MTTDYDDDDYYNNNYDDDSLFRTLHCKGFTQYFSNQNPAFEIEFRYVYV